MFFSLSIVTHTVIHTVFKAKKSTQQERIFSRKDSPCTAQGLERSGFLLFRHLSPQFLNVSLMGGFLSTSEFFVSAFL